MRTEKITELVQAGVIDSNNDAKSVKGTHIKRNTVA